MKKIKFTVFKNILIDSYINLVILRNPLLYMHVINAKFFLLLTKQKFRKWYDFDYIINKTEKKKIFECIKNGEFFK